MLSRRRRLFHRVGPRAAPPVAPQRPKGVERRAPSPGSEMVSSISHGGRQPRPPPSSAEGAWSAAGAAERTTSAQAPTEAFGAAKESKKEPKATKEKGGSSERIEAKLDEVLTSLALARGTLTAIAIVAFAGASVLMRRDGPTNPAVRIKFGL